MVLKIFKEQGVILTALLGLSAFFSMAKTSITTLCSWKVAILLLTEITPKSIAVHNPTEVARFEVHLTERERQKLQVWSRIMPYRESFAWAIVPLFDNSIGGASGRSASPSSRLAPSMPGSSSHEGVLESVAKIALDGKMGYSSGSSIVVEISNLHKVKESYTEESLQDPKRKVHKPVKGVLRLEIEKHQTSNAELENISESASMTNESMDLGDQVTDAMFIKSPNNGSDGPQSSNSKWIPNDEKNASGNGNTHGNPDLNVGDFQAFDFQTTLRNEPFLQLFHSLYVYPLTVSLSRKRNLFVKVELRKDDADVRRQPLEAMYPREPGLSLQKWDHTQVAVGAWVACYHDEIKVSLPAVWTPLHHLLFTFFHVDLQMKLEAPKLVVIGHAALPLATHAQHATAFMFVIFCFVSFLLDLLTYIICSASGVIGMVVHGYFPGLCCGYLDDINVSLLSPYSEMLPSLFR
ncbi:hypothetical protein SLA2020_144980 [Shorea laevis]